MADVVKQSSTLFLRGVEALGDPGPSKETFIRSYINYVFELLLYIFIKRLAA